MSLLGFKCLFRLELQAVLMCCYQNSSFLFFLSLAFLFFPVHSQIPLGSKLTVQDKNFWVSSKGNFAVGFFNRSNQHSLGIRFNSPLIPTHKQTFIWVAGADITVGEKSYFQLTQIGELILFDSARGAVAWASNTTNLSIVSASINDDGNLILLNKNQDIVWQSFDIPSDTLVPGQNLSSSQTLRAASRNSLSSYYSLHVSNHLELKWESNKVYWTSGSPSQSNLRTLLYSDGTVQLLDQRSDPIWAVFGEDHDDQDVEFRFLRLDVDGNLRLYSWVQALSSWRSVWQAVENQCDVFDTCGLCGVCMFNLSGSPVCKCPFSPTSESSSQCLIPYRQGCRSGSSLDTLEHTILYAVYPLNETIIKTSLQQCKSLCQQDPFCFALTFSNDGTAECRIKKTQYVSGYLDPSLSSVSFVKRCLDPIAVFPIRNSTQSSPLQSRKNESKNICIPCLIGVSAGVLVLFVSIHFGIGFWMYRRRRKYADPKSLSVFAGSNPSGFVVLSYTEIKNITEDFKHQIGQSMFKGILENKRSVAVKELNTSTTEERKFRCAVLKIGSISHKSLVKLEGYCSAPGQGQRFLVYEFVKNGSVATCLEDPKIYKRLTWRKRMDICLMVAKAVSYLHNECREFVSHGNLKLENVLLGEKMEVKVGEFGLVSGGSAEVDVHDFGKMVLKLVSGLDNANFELVYEKWSEGGAHEVVDGKIESGLDLDELERVLRISLWCLQNDERMRPSMAEVVKVLEGTLAVDPPPPPFKIMGSGSDSE